MSPRQREEHLRGLQGERAPQGQCACGPGRRRASDNKPSRCRNFDTDSEDPETPRELSGKGSERIRPTLLRMMLSLVWRIDGGGGGGAEAGRPVMEQRQGQVRQGSGPGEQGGGDRWLILARLGT